jgi:hypothetical protein
MIQSKEFQQGDPAWGNIVIGKGTAANGTLYDETMSGFG